MTDDTKVAWLNSVLEIVVLCLMPCLCNMYLHKQELQKKKLRKGLQGNSSVCLYSVTTTLSGPFENTFHLEASKETIKNAGRSCKFPVFSKSKSQLLTYKLQIPPDSAKDDGWTSLTIKQ